MKIRPVIHPVEVWNTDSLIQDRALIVWTRNPSNALRCIMTKETRIKVGFLSPNVYRGPDGEFWQVRVHNEPFCLCPIFSFCLSVMYLARIAMTTVYPINFLIYFILCTYIATCSDFIYQSSWPRFELRCPTESHDYVRLFFCGEWPHTLLLYTTHLNSQKKMSIIHIKPHKIM